MTIEDDFQHFLSYSGLRLKMPEHIGELRQAFFAGADDQEERYDCPIHGTGEGADCPRC